VSVASESARMLDILIPNGGDLVTVSEAFFDESYEDRSPRILCVAGYVFRKSRAVEFGKRWSRFLRAKGLPYFHANECAHGCGIFKGRDDMDEVSRKLIGMTREYSDFGVAVALDQDEYAEICTGHEMFPTPYAYALTNCLYQIAHWRIREKRTAPTAFYFEQGHAHAGDANKFLTFMLRSDELPGRIGYRAHGFVPKETPQVQPGDLLAWLWRLHAQRVKRRDPRPVRKDLVALERPTDRFMIFDREQLTSFRNSIMTHAPAAEAYVHQIAEIVGLSEEDRATVMAWRPDYRTTKF
jgi:hypothetical protein